MKIKTNDKLKKVVKIIKGILFLSMLVLTFFISTNTIDYLLTLEVELLKRGLNIILVAIVVIIYKK